MTKSPHAVIPKANYDLFHAFVPSLPPTYEEWEKEANQAKLQDRQAGLEVLETEVELNEFRRFCNERGGAVRPQQLLKFAIEKAGGKKY